MTRSHLVAAAAALALFGAALAASRLVVRRIVEQRVHAIAPQMFAEKSRGIALQRAAFRQPDLLPLYGSSELNLPDPAHASAVFRSYPTGFTVFPVGDVGSTSLIWLQALAAVGPELRGKRVAVSISPRLFMDEAVEPHAYAANFSSLHANELAFSTRLGFAVKQAAARRMLAYPTTLVGDPLLRFALERLADGSPASRLLYYASLPLGFLHDLVLRMRDDWSTLVFLNGQIGLGPVAAQQAAIDWPQRLRRGEDDARREDDGNPFGFARAFWARHAPEIAAQRGVAAAPAVQRGFEGSAEWTDLDVLLRAIRELGGRPLILSLPMKGVYEEYRGVPAATRAIYHRRLRELAEADGALVVDFAEHDADKDFTVDAGLHLSSEGWVYYDRALDDFFHGRAPAGG